MATAKTTSTVLSARNTSRPMPRPIGNVTLGARNLSGASRNEIAKTMPSHTKVTATATAESGLLIFGVCRRKRVGRPGERSSSVLRLFQSQQQLRDAVRLLSRCEVRGVGDFDEPPPCDVRCEVTQRTWRRGNVVRARDGEDRGADAGQSARTSKSASASQVNA